jgi:hypothetical protein
VCKTHVKEGRQRKALLGEVLGKYGGDRGTARDEKGRFITSEIPQGSNPTLRDRGRDYDLARLRRLPSGSSPEMTPHATMVEALIDEPRARNDARSTRFLPGPLA